MLASTGMPPSRIGPYTIENLLGEGGMGQVFRAHDSRLGRPVAIKIVREEFTDRFEREAHAIAALNHPNVCTLYDVGPNFLAMEFVEGESLAARLARGKLSLERTLAYGMQVASALAAAHAQGIVHRDLKPGNIMLGKSGVKVLDFGLARLADRPVSRGDPTLTAANAILGTPAYIAPEQWRGAIADARSDVYALGVLLYEMATGSRPAPGEALRTAGLPTRLRDLVERCLHADPDERWQSARDLQIELEWIARDLENPAASLSWRHRWPMALAASCAVAALGATLAWLSLRPPVAAPRVRVTTVLPPENTRFDFTRTDGPAALSPDGRSMVFTALGEEGEAQLYLRALDSTAPVPLPGTAGAHHPFWSPDSRWVAFYAAGFLKKIDTHGGAPISLTAAQGPGAGGSWSAKGKIVFIASEFSPLQKIAAGGGSVELATTSEVSGHGYPWFLPDGEHFLFVSWPGAGRATLKLGSLSSTKSTVVGNAESNAIYASGRLLYLRGNALVAQPFDVGSLRTTGEAVPIAEPVQRLGTLLYSGVFSASQNGLIAYQKGTDTLTQLTWFDRSGKAIGKLGEPRAFFDLELSPDGKSLLASAPDALGNFDLWAFDLERGLANRFTTDAGGEYYGRWSADGGTVFFNSTRRGNYDLYRKSASGMGPEELVFADGTDKVPTSVSNDGRQLLYFTGGGEHFQLSRLPLRPDPDGGQRRPERLLDTTADERWAQFSPDDRWIAFESSVSDRPEVYVAPAAQPTEMHRISSNGGVQPRWRRDLQAIIYRDRDGHLQEASLRISGNNLAVTSVEPVFATTSSIGGYGYDLSPDGQKALIAVPAERRSEPLTLVENWLGLER